MLRLEGAGREALKKEELRKLSYSFLCPRERYIVRRYQERLLMVYLISAVALVSVSSCKTQKPRSAEVQKVAATPTPRLAVSWSEDPTDSTDNEALRLAWKRFE